MFFFCYFGSFFNVFLNFNATGIDSLYEVLKKSSIKEPLDWFLCM